VNADSVDYKRHRRENTLGYLRRVSDEVGDLKLFTKRAKSSHHRDLLVKRRPEMNFGEIEAGSSQSEEGSDDDEDNNDDDDEDDNGGPSEEDDGSDEEEEEIELFSGPSTRQRQREQASKRKNQEMEQSGSSHKRSRRGGSDSDGEFFC